MNANNKTKAYNNRNAWKHGVSVREKDNKFSIFIHDEQIIPYELDFVTCYPNGMEVKKGNLFGFYSYSGQVIVPINFISLRHEICGIIVEDEHSLYGFYSYQGTTILPVEFNEIYNFSIYRLQVTKNGLTGIYSHTGEIIVPIEFSFIITTQSRFICFKDNKVYHYSYDGKSIPS